MHLAGLVRVRLHRDRHPTGAAGSMGARLGVVPLKLAQGQVQLDLVFSDL